MPSVREEIRSTVSACDTAARQLRDDVLIHETESAIDILSGAIEGFGNIWLCGNGPGFCQAVEVAHKLTTQVCKLERATRASVLGMNGATSTTSFGKCGIEDALGAELMVQGRRGDALWCFASDPSSRSVLGAVTTAYRQLKIPVVIFTTYPGTPLIRYSDAKIRIQPADERDRSGFCVEWAHAFLANIMVNQLKRLARKYRA